MARASREAPGTVSRACCPHLTLPLSLSLPRGSQLQGEARVRMGMAAACTCARCSGALPTVDAMRATSWLQTARPVKVGPHAPPAHVAAVSTGHVAHLATLGTRVTLGLLSLGGWEHARSCLGSPVSAGGGRQLGWSAACGRWPCCWARGRGSRAAGAGSRGRDLTSVLAVSLGFFVQRAWRQATVRAVCWGLSASLLRQVHGLPCLCSTTAPAATSPALARGQHGWEGQPCGVWGSPVACGAVLGPGPWASNKPRGVQRGSGQFPGCPTRWPGARRVWKVSASTPH